MALFRFVYALLALGDVGLTQTAQKCRCLYGQSCWPDEASFVALSQQLSQPLLRPVPPASACYPVSSPSGDCAEVLAKFTDGSWRSDQPGALENPNFEAYLHRNGTVDGCYRDTTLGFPCKQGSVPPIGVDARTVEDVQAAVVFARKNNLRLVVKNTGHDYLGRSAGRGGFMLWTHHFKDKSHSDSFVPQGAPTYSKTYNAITLGAGVQWYEAYEYANQQGRFILGGISLGGTVGAAGGWLLGGGHSAFAPRHGLGVDNVIQLTIVVADGRHLTVNAYQHSDLFWALRGGGGGTYGVVTSATYQSHPEFPLTMSAIITNFSSPDIAQSVITEFISLHANLSDAQWGGYTSFSRSNFQVLYVSPNVSQEVAEATLAPFVARTNTTTGGAVQTLFFALSSFYTWYNAVFNAPNQGTQVGFQVELASRLLPYKLAKEQPAKIAKTLLSIEGGVAGNLIAGGVIRSIDPSSTGLNPSWRKAIGQFYVSVGWPEGATGSEILHQRNILKQNADVLDKITTDSGSYVNEGSLYERDFRKTYFGSHYSRLRSIKRKYDAGSLFVVPSGVGSDEWDIDTQCRR
ncbi:unnamed protein product [Cyclocybe aegerita]|uniref:FAD-binding PCMH-type domain-containing protein n=1 Tax=Cyclocybe aegerita TaxID=1973307 RepID=A0A8S0XQG5_CYCAE|nr:unnamed protein product [Cyclocybe aegerita]